MKKLLILLLPLITVACKSDLKKELESKLLPGAEIMNEREGNGYICFDYEYEGEKSKGFLKRTSSGFLQIDEGTTLAKVAENNCNK